jgi:hypothetical protein
LLKGVFGDREREISAGGERGGARERERGEVRRERKKMHGF